MFEQLADLFDHGGIVMVILSFISIYMIAVIIFKLYQFYRMQTLNPLFVEQLDSEMSFNALVSKIEAANFEQNPVANVMITSLKSISKAAGHKESFSICKEEIGRVAAAELRYLEAHMRGLELVANISPLLGLLGTVIGMVGAFSQLEQAGANVDPSLLAGGIWTALITTVAGLSVAIPALAAHNIFDGKIESVRAGMQDVAVRIFSLSERLAKNNNNHNNNCD